jgi:hypothetical protein
VLAEAHADEIPTSALADHARGLFCAGELDEASVVTTRALEHPVIERHVASVVVACSTLALLDTERGCLAFARGHAQKARAAVGRVGTSRTRLGANASAARGFLLIAEGSLADAEQARLPATFLPLRGADAAPHVAARSPRPRPSPPRPPRGAETTLHSARPALGEPVDSRLVPALADEV